MTPAELRRRIEAWYELPAESLGQEARSAFDALLAGLESGEVRAAEPGPDGWQVNGWVKKGILLGFRLGPPCAAIRLRRSCSWTRTRIRRAASSPPTECAWCPGAARSGAGPTSARASS